MSVLSTLVTVLLVAQSILGLGLFLQAMISTRLRRSETLSALTSLHHHLLDLQRLAAKSKKPMANLALGFRVGKMLNETKCPELLRQAVLFTVGPESDDEAATTCVASWIQNLDRGAQRIGGFLTKTAPLMGLGGTLTGISESMHAFGGNATSPEVIVHGFAVAIETTLYGIFVAIFCLMATRLLWQPILEDASGMWLDISNILRSLRQKSVSSTVASEQSGQQRRRPPKGIEGTPVIFRTSVVRSRRASHAINSQ